MLKQESKIIYHILVQLLVKSEIKKKSNPLIYWWFFCWWWWWWLLLLMSCESSPCQDVVLDKPHHHEAIHFLSFDSDDSGQRCIRHKASSIEWILQLMGLDVIPEQPRDQGSGGRLAADDGGQCGVHCDRSLQGHVTSVPSTRQLPPSSNSSVSGQSFGTILAPDQVVLVEVPARAPFFSAPWTFSHWLEGWWPCHTWRSGTGDKNWIIVKTEIVHFIRGVNSDTASQFRTKRSSCPLPDTRHMIFLNFFK